jgi:hypothetical protein
VSEGGLEPRSWWYIPKRGIHHHSKLTRHGPARARISQAKRGGSTGLPDRPRHVTCGNDEGGEPEPGRTQGPDRGSRSTTLNHQGSTVTASRCCSPVPAPQPQPGKPAQMTLPPS